MMGAASPQLDGKVPARALPPRLERLLCAGSTMGSESFAMLAVRYAGGDLKASSGV